MSGDAPENVDRAYCVAAMDALRRLEVNAFHRNEVAREYDRVAHRRWIEGVSVVSLILPALLWVYFLAARTGFAHLHQVPSETAGAIAASVFLFLVVFVAGLILGSSQSFPRVRDRFMPRLRRRFERARGEVDATAQAILAEPVLSDGRIPEQFLSSRMLGVLLRFFDAGQATFLEAAVYMLDSELRNSDYYRNLVPAQTMIAREREAIAADSAGHGSRP